MDIILSSRQVQLDQYNHAVLNLKAIFPVVPSGLMGLYKVRTNSKDLVDVRPSFGVLANQTGDDSVATLNIKYLGSLEAVQKMKLQISWVWDQAVIQEKLSHAEFSELYGSFKLKIGKEKTQMLDFGSRSQAAEAQDSIELTDRSKYSQSSQGQSKEEICLPELEETREKTEVKENGVKQDKEKATRKDKKEKYETHENYERHETHEKEDVKAVVAEPRVSWTWVILGVAVAFMLGLLTGLKLQNQYSFLSHSQQHPEETQPEDSTPLDAQPMPLSSPSQPSSPSQDI